MKLKILNTKNSENGTITFPISEAYRADLIKRACEALQSKQRQAYGSDPRSGFKHSVLVSRRRRKYRGSYGKGISRVPRKILSRNGSQFHWKGAQVSGTVGGHRAHGPKAEKIWARKINKKENRKAINSAMCAALDKNLVAQRGHNIPKSYPFALDQDFDKISKTKDLLAALDKLGFSEELQRGQEGAKSILIVSENQELKKAAKNIPGVDVAAANQLNAHILAPGTHAGRATLFTKQSIEELK